MNKDCEVIRDLLPLYADEVCSERSRELIEEHLHECPDCSAMLEKLRTHEIETDLREEKEQVIEYQAKRFKRRSATVGSTVTYGALLLARFTVPSFATRAGVLVSTYVYAAFAPNGNASIIANVNNIFVCIVYSPLSVTKTKEQPPILMVVGG